MFSAGCKSWHKDGDALSLSRKNRSASILDDFPNSVPLLTLGFAGPESRHVGGGPGCLPVVFDRTELVFMPNQGRCGDQNDQSGRATAAGR